MIDFMPIEQRTAAMQLLLALPRGRRVTPCGWRVAAVIDAQPWPWVWLVRGQEHGRASPLAVMREINYAS